jgi:hypothetical protein
MRTCTGGQDGPGFKYADGGIKERGDSRKKAGAKHSFGHRDEHDVHLTKGGFAIKMVGSDYSNLPQDRPSTAGATISNIDGNRARTPNSKQRNQPEFSFGSGLRFQGGRSATPGPIYSITADMGEGSRGSAFGNGMRGNGFEKGSYMDSPGPSQYQASRQGAVGAQSESNSVTAPMYRFGTSQRTDDERMYKLNDGTGMDLNKGGTGRNVPGPGAYEQKRDIGMAGKYSFGGRNCKRGVMAETISKGTRSHTIL